jgi:hypothetical protein
MDKPRSSVSYTKKCDILDPKTFEPPTTTPEHLQFLCLRLLRILFPVFQSLLVPLRSKAFTYSASNSPQESRPGISKFSLDIPVYNGSHR